MLHLPESHFPLLLRFFRRHWLIVSDAYPLRNSLVEHLRPLLRNRESLRWRFRILCCGNRSYGKSPKAATPVVVPT